MKYTKVFAYGTLRSWNPVRGLQRFHGTELIGEAVTSYPSYDIHSIHGGRAPGVSIDGSYHIRGEVWSVPDYFMDYLDEREGYPYVYDREKIMTDKGIAWLYHIQDIQDYNPTDRDIYLSGNGQTKAWLPSEMV